MQIAGREANIYGGSSTAPLVVLNTVGNEGEEVYRKTKELDSPDYTLLSVQIDDWNASMTPWKEKAVASWDSDYEGKADEYIASLVDCIIPSIISRFSLNPAFIAIAGYSLGGLFALYTMYKTDVFTRFASVSGSLWYPGFSEFAENASPIAKPEGIYLSLGNKEAKTRNPLMRNVLNSTGELYRHYDALGIKTVFEMNEGNHFSETELRMARGIRWLLNK